MAKLTEKDLPAPGKGRWWKIELIPNAASNPIRVTLMESLVPGRKGLSTKLGYTRTVAVSEKVKLAADLVLVQVGGYADVIGEFGDDGSPALEAVA